MSKHTPGPWRAVETYVYSPENRTIGQTNPFADQLVSCANARLIAAAPELLEALKVLADTVEHAWPSLASLGPMIAARAALAKAEGHGL